MSKKRSFFMQRLNDHIQYLDKVTKTLKGHSDFAGCDCRHCQLGKWLYGEAMEEVQQYDEEVQALFQTLLERHELFHQVSNEALISHHAGDANTAYKSMTEMHKLSNQLVNLLLKIDRHAQQAVAA